jgi:hypothetical protein
MPRISVECNIFNEEGKLSGRLLTSEEVFTVKIDRANGKEYNY